MATPAQLFTQNANFDVQRHRELQDEQRKQNLELNWGVINNPDATPEQKTAAQGNIQSLYPTPFHAPQFLQDLMHLKQKGQKQQQVQSQANVAANTPQAPPAQAPPMSEHIGLPGAGASMGESTSPQLQVPPQASPAQSTQPASTAPAAGTPPLAQVQQVAQAKSPQEALSKINPQKFPLVQGYASPQDIQNQYAVKLANLSHEHAMELYGERGQTARDVAEIRAQYQLLSTPEKMYLDAQAKGMGFPNFFSVPPQYQGGMLSGYHNAASPKYISDFVQDANSPTGWSRATWNPVTQETLDVYPGVRPPNGMVARHRVSTQPGPNGMVTTISDVTPSMPGGPAQPFVPPTPTKGVKQSNAGGPQGTPKAPVSANTPTGPLEGVSNPPDDGNVTSTAPVSANTPQGPPSTAAANQEAINGKLNKKKSLSKQIPAQIPAPVETQHPDEPPPLRNPKLPPMKGADEQRVASVAAPMATVEQQVVGRGIKPLWEYSNVLQNPELLKAVNYAMNAPMLQTPEGNKNISFWGTLATAMGLASAAQQATTDTITATRNKVQQDGGPEAVEFLDRLAELKGTIPNLRKIQGGSNAMGAIQPLYQESPIMNISSPADFRNRTANMLRTMAVALNEAPGINKKHVDWLYEQADKAQGKGAKPTASGGKSSKVDDFLKNF